jgi:hypothetical protein
MNARQQRQLFSEYWLHRVREAEAITPGQKLALLDALDRETDGQDDAKPGQVRVPREGGGSVLLPADHALVQAALAGRPVAAGGTVIRNAAPATPGERLQGMGDGQKVATLAAIALIPLLIVGLLLFGRNRSSALAAALPTAMPTVTATPTGTPPPMEVPVVITEVITVTPQPERVVATPTPFSIALMSGEAAPSGNDPASVELGGFSYILATGQVANGVWQPQGAEWLAGTALRRVVAVPFEPEIANAVAATRPGAVIRLRLRSGEITKYRVVEVRRQQRQEIEVLADRAPSLVVVLHGEPTAERWVVIAEAIQEPQAFTVYTAPTSTDSTTTQPAPSPVPQATVITTAWATTITSTHTITHTEAGLVLDVGQCERAERIGETTPPRNNQQFMTCTVTLTALESVTGTVPFSGETLAITEEAWITTQLDWWPPAVTVSRALRSGTLVAGHATTGRIAGIVNQASSSPIGGRRSQPTLVWEQAGQRYLIHIQE